MKKAKWIVVSVIAVIVVIIALVVGANVIMNGQHTSSSAAVEPKLIVEEFEISSLEYQYQLVVTKTEQEQRHFLFITLDSSFKGYAYQLDGTMKLGVNGKDIKVKKTGISDKKITITIPKAQILSNEPMWGNSGKPLFDIHVNTKEGFSATQGLTELNKVKGELEKKVVEDNILLPQAQESAKKQLKSLLEAIPEIKENYELKFILE
ncbi:MAG: DUF4230 domain-containing protein [Lactobacillales bacterium]|jgi:hypothetical protein|nr:DUF4230 domain-containing protein [Lactobacillales bacterium]